MSEIKFSCPSCQQHIQCDTGYSGMQINCPACNASMIVPGEPAAVAPPPAPAAHACPECNTPLPPGAVLCTGCGYNLRTGERMATPPSQAPPRKKKKKKKGRRRGADPYEEKWYASPWTYVGVLAVIFGTLFLLGKKSPWATVAFAGLAVIYMLAIHIAVVVHAFKNDGVGWAIFCFCIPLVGLYYVYWRSQSPFLQIFYTVGIVLNIVLRFLDFAAMAGDIDDYEEFDWPTDEQMSTNDVAPFDAP